MIAQRFVMACAFALALLHASASAASVDQGQASYVDHGCWGCHGFVGQGGTTGPKLAPEPKPLEFFNAFIRHTPGRMPPYSEKILSNEDLANIHAYLKSIPGTKDYRTIPLLKE